MFLPVGNECCRAAISNHCINPIARSDTPPEVSVWAKVKAFFCQTHTSEALECIRTICHPPAGTTREEVSNRFEQLRTLAHPGFGENIQSGRHGDNHFCILDENSREILSVTLDDAGKYTVKCQEHTETIDAVRGGEYAERAAAAPARTAKDYEAAWSAWERAAPPEEARDRASVVNILRQRQNDNSGSLDLRSLKITSLPDPLPSDITNMLIIKVPLTHQQMLPDNLTHLSITDTQLTHLPELPHRLTRLVVNHTSITRLPESITRLSPRAYVDISNNPLSERTLQALRDMTSAPDYSGPSIHFSMDDPSEPRETLPLHQEVAGWQQKRVSRPPYGSFLDRKIMQTLLAASWAGWVRRKTSKKTPVLKPISPPG